MQQMQGIVWAEGGIGGYTRIKVIWEFMTCSCRLPLR